MCSSDKPVPDNLDHDSPGGNFVNNLPGIGRNIDSNHHMQSRQYKLNMEQVVDEESCNL